MLASYFRLFFAVQRHFNGKLNQIFAQINWIVLQRWCCINASVSIYAVVSIVSLSTNLAHVTDPLSSSILLRM